MEITRAVFRRHRRTFGAGLIVAISLLFASPVFCCPPTEDHAEPDRGGIEIGLALTSSEPPCGDSHSDHHHDAVLDAPTVPVRMAGDASCPIIEYTAVAEFPVTSDLVVRKRLERRRCPPSGRTLLIDLCVARS